MSRLMFEDDEVIREALMMDSDSDSNVDCNLIEAGPKLSKKSTSDSTVQQRKNRNILNIDEEFTNKEMEDKQNSVTKYRCQNCLQEFEKKKLQNHDCGKKKRKSLVLSFHRNLTVTSSRINDKSIRKSDIKNDTAQSDKIQSIDSSTSEIIRKNNHKKSVKHDKNNDLDVNEQNFEIKKSKTPIFYECPTCFQHFTKNEFDIHHCRDNSPCLTLKFSTSSHFNDSGDKYDRNKPRRAKMSGHFEKIIKTDTKTFTQKEKALVKRKRDNSMSFSTELKQPIKSQHFENEKALQQHNQPIALESDTKRKKTIKRKSPDSGDGTEKEVHEPKTKNIKIDKPNNETNQFVNTTLEGSVGDVNRIVAIGTPSQKSTTKNTDQPNDKDPELKQTVLNKRILESSKQIVTSQSEEKKKVIKTDKTPKRNENSSKNVSKNVISEKQNMCRINKRKVLLEEQKEGTGCQNEGTDNRNLVNKKAEAVTTRNEQDGTTEIKKSNKQNEVKQIVITSQSEERKKDKNSDKLLKRGEISAKSTDKRDEKSQNVISENYKIFRLNELKILLEKDKEGTGCPNLVNMKAEVLQQHNQPIALESDTKRKKTIKRNSPDSGDGTEKEVHEPKTKNIKIDKPNNETNQFVNTTLEGSVGDVNRIVAIGTPRQKSTTKNTDQPNDEDPELKQTVLNKRILESSKQIVTSQSEEKKKVIKTDKTPKRNENSSKNVSKNVISEKQNMCRINKRKVLLEEQKEGTGCQNEGTDNRNLVNKKAEAVTTRNEQDGTTEIKKSNKQNEVKQIVITSQSEERKKDKNSDKLLKRGEISAKSTDKRDEKSQNVISENYKIFRLNELKILLEKDKEGTGCQNLVNMKAEVITTRNEQESITEDENSGNQKEAEGNRNSENVEAIFTLNEKNNGTEQEKSFQTELSQEGKTETEIIKKTKRPSFQNKNKCRLCYAKYTKIKHYNHICKYKVKKTKSKQNKRQIVKKSDTILKNCKNNSQSKINITILSRENVKIVTVSNNAKDYEVNQGDISHYVHYDQISKENEIKEITGQIHKSSTETVFESELSNESEKKTFEKEKVTFDMTEKTELLKSQHRNADGQNSDITSKEFSICDGNSTIQENDANFVESHKQNKNEKDDEKQLTKNSHNNSNPTEIENTSLSQNSDHNYSITVVENNQSITTVDSNHTVSTRDVEHNYSVTEENIISTYKIGDINMITKTTENDTIVTENERAINGTEINTTINKENETITTENLITLTENKQKEIILNENQMTSSKNKEKETIRIQYEENRIPKSNNEITTSENAISLPENVGREVAISESEITNLESEITESESEITISECKITVPENVESEVIIPESAKSQIIVPESEITISEYEIVLPKNVKITIPESTIPESQIPGPEIVGNQMTVITQNENTTSTQNINIENFTHQIGSIDCDIISNDNVENEVIIAAQYEGINNNELTLKDNSFSIDDVAQEIIIPAIEEEITYEESAIVPADVENHVSIATQIKDDSLVSIENVDQEVTIINENKETDDASVENVGTLIVITERDEDVVIQNAENIENHTQNEEIEKVSVETLENEVFVSNYVGEKDSIKGVQIETNVSATNAEASDSIEDVQTNKTYISKKYENNVSTQTKTNVLCKNVETTASVKEVQNETDVTTKNVSPSDLINDTNISQNNVSVENMRDTIGEVAEANQDQSTVNIDNGNNILVQNQLTISAEKEQCILPSQNGQREKIVPTNDEIETIIIISSEDENKKNIVLTQNEKNETVIIISKQKEEITSDYNTVSSRIQEITTQDHQIKKIVGNQSNKLSLTEKNDIRTKKDRKCLKCSQTFTKDELKTHNCTEEGRDKIKKGKITEFNFSNEKELPKKGLNNHKCGENIRLKEKDDSLSIETELATILNQTDSQNKILETHERFSNCPGTHKCDEHNKEKEDNTLESQLAAILNQNESQNKMAVKGEHSRIGSANNIRNDDMTVENNGSPMTENQLLDILSKNVDDTSQVENSSKINYDTAQKENSSKTKCFRCSKEFTDRELTTHNCLKESRDQNSDNMEKNTTEVEISRQNDDATEKNILYVVEIKENSEPVEKICKAHIIPKAKCVRCFNCSEIYDKTHKCSNIEKEKENMNISLENPKLNTSQDESKPEDTKFIKKNKYYFDMYILKTKQGTYKCKICKKEYTARKNLVRHIHKHEKGYEERFKCSLCPKKFHYKASLKSHEACHAGETYACSICQKSFTRKTNLYAHLKLHRDEKFSCDICGKEYTSKQCLINHPCFNTKIYSCEFCDKKYRAKVNLIDHLHSHVGLKPYTCEFCNEKIAFRGKYLRHTQNCAVAKQQKENMKENQEETVKHNKNSPFSCKICSITLRNKSQLQQHEWRHENKHFFCHICPKKFNSKHYLQLHLASHEELGIKRKKFDCPDCDKQFSTKFGLKLHLNKHNDIKFSCPLCEKLFTTKLLLKTHEITHTGQNPYVCDNCKKAFNNRSNYNRHKKNKVCFFMPMET